MIENMEAVMHEQAKASIMQAEVLKSLVGMYKVDSPPTVRLNGDEYRIEKEREAYLESLGYPVKGTEVDKLRWQMNLIGGDED